MSTGFYLPVEIVFGVGAIQKLGDITSKYGHNALIVTGKHSIARSGLLVRIRETLERHRIQVAMFSEIEPEPNVETVDRGARRARDFKTDVVIGIGGGSAIDAAKAIAFTTRQQHSAEDYLNGRKMEGFGLPIVAVPTLAGSGSECSPTVVLSDPKKCHKSSFRNACLFPRIALIDPELAVTASPQITSISGIDALTQAIEAYVSKYANPLTKALALESTRLIYRSLERSFNYPKDVDARSDLAWGAAMTGYAFSCSRLGAAHGLAHPLGHRYRIPHGLACGILLPYIINFNRQVAGDDYAMLCQIMELEGSDDPVDRLISAIEALLTALDMPLGLNKYKITSESMNTLARESMPSGSLAANPREATEKDLTWILDLACKK
jgi:alcohol dehydrogenase class IV